MSTEWKIKNLARHLWCLGFSFVTFDQALVWKFQSFNFKLCYGFFFLSFLLTLTAVIKESGLRQSFAKYASILLRSPWLFASLLLANALLLLPISYVAKKSVAYSTWLSFDLLAILATAILLFSREHNPKEDSSRLRGLWMKYLWGSLVGLALVVHIDYFAFFYGYRSGLIGFNQGADSWYGYSRPHAFAYEASYLALYFGFGFIYLLFESIVSAKPIIPRWLSLPALVLSMNVILLTFARSILITMTLSIFLLVLFLIHRGKLHVTKINHLVVAFLLSIATIVSLTPKNQLIAAYDRMIYRAFVGKDGSIDSRLDGFRVAWDAAKSSKFVGVGIGSSYAYWYFELEGAPSIKGLVLPQTIYQRHKIQSLWMEILAELGALGVLLFASLAGAVCVHSWRATRRDPGMDSYVAFAMLSVFFLFTAHWFPNLCRPDIWAWIGVWGASIANGVPNDGKSPLPRPNPG